MATVVCLKSIATPFAIYERTFAIDKPLALWTRGLSVENFSDLKLRSFLLSALPKPKIYAQNSKEQFSSSINKIINKLLYITDYV